MRPVFVTITVVKKRSIAPNFDALEQILDHKFGDPLLLERALTHRSWAHEQVAPGDEETARRLHNEALEFLGDSVLGLIVADYLLQAYPNATEGELSRMKHRLVSATTLARVAEALSFGQFLRVGRGEEKSGGRRKCALLADAFEAVLAAVYLDAGFPAAISFLHHTLGDELKKADPKLAGAGDYKTLLQEMLHAAGQDSPRYEVVEMAGPPHRRTFCVEVLWSGCRARGEGRSIKAAETAAARQAVDCLKTETASATTRDGGGTARFDKHTSSTLT
jgi:ribonuclease-3